MSSREGLEIEGLSFNFNLKQIGIDDPKLIINIGIIALGLVLASKGGIAGYIGLAIAGIGFLMLVYGTAVSK